MEGRWSLILSVAVCFLILPSEAVARRVFEVGRWEGFVEFGFEWDSEKSTSEGAGDLALRKLRFEEKVGLRNSSFILDPRFVRLDSGLTAGFFQERLSVNGEESPSDGRILGYDLTATVLPEKPYTLTLFANRGQSSISREFAGTSDVLTENRGGTLSLKRIFLPSTLSYRRELLEEESRFGAFVGRREEVRNVFTYDARRTWEANDLSVRYEFADVDDRVFPKFSYRTHTAGLHHRLDFGEAVPKTLVSSFRYFRRGGRFEFSSMGIDEDLHIRHGEDLTTGYHYSFSRFSTQDGATTSHTGILSLGHQLYGSLTTDLSLRGTFSTFPTGRESIYGGRADLTYRKRIFWGGRLLAGLGGSYEVQDDRFEEREAFISREQHVARIGAPFRLDRPRVIAGSIVVIDEAGTSLFQEGLDYVVRFVGHFAEIDIVPGGRIADGRTLVVDYRVIVSPSVKFSTWANRFNIGFDYGWIYPFYSYERVTQDLLSGTDETFLEDMTDHTAGVEFRWDGTKFRGSLRNEYRTHDSRLLSFDALQFRQLLSYFPHPTVSLSLSLNESLFDFRDPTRERTSVVGRFSLGWRPRPTLSLEGFASARLWSDSISPDETAHKVGVRGMWSIGKFEMIPSFEYGVRERDGSDSQESRVMIRLIRRF